MTDNKSLSAELEALRPCPFCGSEELSHGSACPGFTAECHGLVQCHSCDAYMLGATEMDAITAWNTRVPPPGNAGLREGVEDVLRHALSDEAQAAGRIDGKSRTKVIIEATNSILSLPSIDRREVVEECARVAENKWPEIAYDAPYRLAGRNIAAAIRKLSPAGEKGNG